MSLGSSEMFRLPDMKELPSPHRVAQKSSKRSRLYLSPGAVIC